MPLVKLIRHTKAVSLAQVEDDKKEAIGIAGKSETGTSVSVISTFIRLARSRMSRLIPSRSPLSSVRSQRYAPISPKKT